MGGMEESGEKAKDFKGTMKTLNDIFKAYIDYQ